MTDDQIVAATAKFREDCERQGKKTPGTLPPRIFCEIDGRRPLLILRFVTPSLGSTGPVLTWSICFLPSNIAGGTVAYVVNMIRMREMFGEEEIEEEARGDAE